MNVLAVFLATVALAAGSYPSEVKTWTYLELEQAYGDDSHPDLEPYIDKARRKVMAAVIAGDDLSVYAAVPSPSGQDSWTMKEMDKVMKDQPNHPYRDQIDNARDNLDEAIQHGFDKNVIPVGVESLDLSIWTLEDIDKALKSDRTNQDLIPLLKTARIDLKKSKKRDTIGLVTPVGLIPHKGIPELLPMPEESVYTWAQENDVPISIYNIEKNTLSDILKRILKKINSVFGSLLGR